MTTEAIRQRPLTDEPADNAFVVWYDPNREPYAVYFRSDANAWDDDQRWFNADQAGGDPDGPFVWNELCDEMRGNDGPHLLVPGAKFDGARDAITAHLREVGRLETIRTQLEKQLTETTAALTASRTQAANRGDEVGRLVAENARLRSQLAELEPIVEAAKYEYGARPCMEGDCDHAAEVDENAPDDAICPLIETRHATAAEILAVELLLISNDGDPLDDAEEIPVGEIRRALGETREAVTR